MSHRRRQSGVLHASTAKRSRLATSVEDEGAIQSSLTDSSQCFVNKLPTDLLMLIFSYFPLYPRFKVLKFVCKRWLDVAYRSITSLPSLYFKWNWTFMLSRCPSIHTIQYDDNPSFHLPASMPRLTELNLSHPKFRTCACEWMTNLSCLRTARLSLFETCPPLTTLLSNHMTSLTDLRLHIDTPALSSLSLPYLQHLRLCIPHEAQLHIAEELIAAHASQLSSLRLTSSHSPISQELELPRLAFLKLLVQPSFDVSFIARCTALTTIKLGLCLENPSFPDLSHLLPYVTSIHCNFLVVPQHIVADIVRQTTRLTSLRKCMPGVSVAAADELIAPHAPQLRKLELFSTRRSDCTAVLTQCTALRALTLLNLDVSPDRATLMNVRSLIVAAPWHSQRSILGSLSNLLLLAPRLSVILLMLPALNGQLASLSKFMKEAEFAGVEELHLNVHDEDLERVRELGREMTWLHVTTGVSSY